VKEFNHQGSRDLKSATVSVFNTEDLDQKSASKKKNQENLVPLSMGTDLDNYFQTISNIVTCNNKKTTHDREFSFDSSMVFKDKQNVSIRGS
jgi:hypothetical protein